MEISHRLHIKAPDRLSIEQPYQSSGSHLCSNPFRYAPNKQHTYALLHKRSFTLHLFI